MNGELFKLAVQGLVRKKRSSLLLFMVLFLSFSFAIVSLNVTGSIQATNKEYLRDTYGTWYGAIPAGTEEDEAWLRRQAWLDRLGVCKSYGSIASGDSIGTMDETFMDIGRIGLQTGRFPGSGGEIAVEADTLSALGCDYTLGQELTFTVQVPDLMQLYDEETGRLLTLRDAIEVERTFTLVGVLREYSDLWIRDRNQNNLPLNSAVITAGDAEALRQAARDKIPDLLKEGAKMGLRGLELSPVVPQYHYTIFPGTEAQMERDMKGYMYPSGTRATTPEGYPQGDVLPSVNSLVYTGEGSEEQGRDTFYSRIILAMTVLAVICIYAIRLQDEARQLATFRSIGITKRQLCMMLLYETLCLGLPALLLGMAGGLAGTWAVLRLAVYSGSVPIRVDFPAGLLAEAAGLWLLGVAGARLAVFLTALRTPLTGRLRIARKAAWRNRIVRQAMIAALSILLSATVLFTCLNSLSPRYLMNTWNSYPDYSVHDGFHDGDIRLDYPIPKEVAVSIRQIPGVEYAWGFSEIEVELEFDGMEHVALARDYGEDRKAYCMDEHPEDAAMVTWLFVVQPEDWKDTIGFAAAGVDMDRFRAGDAVVVSFPVNEAKSEFLYHTEEERTYLDCGIEAGDTIHIARALEGLEIDVEVGGIQYMPPSMYYRTLASMASPYAIICSEAFLEKLVAQADQLGPKETVARRYRPDEPYGYERIHVFADLNADYFSTDTMMAQICKNEGLFLSSSREEYQVHVQENLQKLILLWTGGGCASLVLALILWNTLAMEAERKRQNYGILQALGLSRRRMRLRQMGTALGRGAAAAALGWLIYVGYDAYYWLREYLSHTAADSLGERIGERLNSVLFVLGRPQQAVLLTALCVALVVGLSWLAQRRLYQGNPMEKLRDEH